MSVEPGKNKWVWEEGGKGERRTMWGGGDLGSVRSFPQLMRICLPWRRGGAMESE